jgi:hypothetical protein
MKSLQGVSPEALVWRPAPHSNCIAEIAFHMARAEDRMVSSRAGLGEEIWESQKWYERFGYPREQDRKTDFQMTGAPGVPVVTCENLVGYIRALHENSLARLEALTMEDLDRPPDPSRPEYTTATYLRHLIVHSNNHHGQIDFIRGLIEDQWDLPPGTGIVLD